VVVALESQPDGPTLVVADDGPGIPPQDRARVTERFVRLETSRNSPGTGLGLSLVAAVARMHEAELTFDDNHPGLRATLSFKRVAEEPRPAKPTPARVEVLPEPVH
jgi:signal transduction histidine kinase